MKTFIAIDLKSFFAFCECLDKNYDPFTTPLIVCHPTHRGAMTLAVSPYVKSLGVKSRTRVYDLPKNVKFIKVPPRMGLYAKKSSEVFNVYKEYFSENDIHKYSIDEVFIDVTSYLKLYKKTPRELALFLLSEVTRKTGLMAAAGIGPNIFMAKVAMDLEAKKNKDSVAEWFYTDIKDKLWGVTPLSKIWGIGPRMEANLNNLGIFTVKDLAHFNKNILKDKYGVLGLELWNHSNGIDNSTIKDYNKEPKNASISHSQVLYKDYNGSNISIIIRETIDLLAKRLRDSKKRAGIITFKVKYSKSVSGGFKKSLRLDNPVKDENEMFNLCMNIFDQFYDNKPIRQISIQLSNLCADIGEQLSLFDTFEEITKKKKKNEAIDFIKEKYGTNSLLRASSLLDDSTIIERNKKNGI